MRAWLQNAFGGSEVRRLVEVSAPLPLADEAVVRVVACALNRLDILQREAAVLDTFTLPHIGGMDVVGIVKEVGSSEDADLLGRVVVVDPVVTDETCDRCRAGLQQYCRALRTIGSTRDGGLAEFVAVPVRNLHIVGVALDDIQAMVELASVPVAAVTAWHGLLGAGRIREGETVVIPGAGSGLGTTGIQLAKAAGCTVIAIVGDADKVSAAAELGADYVIDRHAGDWVTAAREATGGDGADLVWDHVGGRFLQQAIDATRIGGRVVMSGTTDGGLSTISNTSVFHWGRTLVGHGGYTRDEMADTIEAYLSRRLHAVIDSVWPFEKALDAEARLESGRFFGKVVVMAPGFDVPGRFA